MCSPRPSHAARALFSGVCEHLTHPFPIASAPAHDFTRLHLHLHAHTLSPSCASTHTLASTHTYVRSQPDCLHNSPHNRQTSAPFRTGVALRQPHTTRRDYRRVQPRRVRPGHLRRRQQSRVACDSVLHDTCSRTVLGGREDRSGLLSSCHASAHSVAGVGCELLHAFFYMKKKNNIWRSQGCQVQYSNKHPLYFVINSHARVHARTLPPPPTHTCTSLTHHAHAHLQVGIAPPGTKFTYDSNVYISHLSYLLHHVTGEPPVEWATREFAIPLGLPDFFAYDNFGEEVSAGGGQLMSCRDALRVCGLPQARVIRASLVYRHSYAYTLSFFTRSNRHV
jgi:hypothetical protein